MQGELLDSESFRYYGRFSQNAALTMKKFDSTMNVVALINPSYEKRNFQK